MVFSSILFLFTFLPLVLVFYYVSPKTLRNALLLLASLFFYAWGEPVYVFLMLFTILFDYFMGLFMDAQRGRKRKIIFIVTLIVNLGFLFFFKYYGFLIETINQIFSIAIPYETLALPIGISFYTFQILSYVIDLYLKKVQSQKNIISFGLYVTMFPQLIAGPIVRYSDINAQLSSRTVDQEKFGLGVERFIQGLGKKVLLANNIGYVWTMIQGMGTSELSVLTAWIGIIAFTFQIYFDFSGYSDMAIGLGKMFGFDFMENFNYPYISKSVSEFWRRWHISLGTWFKEYLYIPLGGNRVPIPRLFINLCIVWLLTGLWHGASWNFVIWGGYYGLILFFEKVFFQKYLEMAPNFLQHIYTMILVIIGWVFFASPDMSYALDYIRILFFSAQHTLVDSTAIYYLGTNALLFLLCIVCSTPIIKITFKKLIHTEKSWIVPLALSLNGIIILLSIAYLVTETYNPFLYFRF
ncbi:MBOAT family O-acyltransferase [Acetobacterium bakii]|uniref:Alginate regulatory protein n=1 Tax=Acetobacterium bakii TaxID=52689 RepID=A0A0L6U3H0_9FIRM|nr:MBOAT family O-acyltransferase [Acetobacterium bakii]KNZ42877.1 alginate regulatory protein [Acetobacterium bakii]